MLIIAFITVPINIRVGGMINNNGDITMLEEAVFLPTQHNRMKYQKQPTLFMSLEANHCRFYVERPLNTQINEKKAFDSILNLSPNTNTKCNLKNKQNIINNTNTTSFINANNDNNMTPNNKQYTIYMKHEYVDILSFIIKRNINCPLYMNNSMETSLNPEQIRVSAAAKRIMYEDMNAGGCSELSEGFSFEILRNCLNAKLVKTEMAIKYWWNAWKKTDYSIKMNERTIGVSVTRAMKYNGLFTKYDAIKLLTKKFKGINESSIGVLSCDEWQRQILHIWATDEYIEEILYKTFLELLFTDPELIGNSIVFVSVASFDMWWIFYQDKYFNKKEIKKKKIKRIKGIKKHCLLTAVT